MFLTIHTRKVKLHFILEMGLRLEMCFQPQKDFRLENEFCCNLENLKHTRKFSTTILEILNEQSILEMVQVQARNLDCILES